jgi:hypothetical protein
MRVLLEAQYVVARLGLSALFEQLACVDGPREPVGRTGCREQRRCPF